MAPATLSKTATILSRAQDRINIGVAASAAVAVLLCMVLGTADVLAARLLNRPLAGTIEATAMLVVLMVFGPLALIQREKSHIRVELVYELLGDRGRAILDVVASALGIVFFVLIGWYGWQNALSSVAIAEAAAGLVRFPIYPAKLILALAVSVLVLQLIRDLWESLRKAVSRSA